MKSKVIHIIIDEKLKKFKFVRRGKYRVRSGIKVTKNNREQVRRNCLLDSLDDKVLSVQSGSWIIARKVGRNNTEFEVMFKKKVYEYGISGMGSNFVNMRSKMFTDHNSSASFEAICT